MMDVKKNGDKMWAKIWGNDMKLFGDSPPKKGYFSEKSP